jgi:3'-phosphoadenosine 5'-phosphosulfate (PAPS) 3'-phosphatase
LTHCITAAGDEIASVKSTALKQKYKERYELVTDADRLSHTILLSSLKNLLGIHLNYGRNEQG